MKQEGGRRGRSERSEREKGMERRAKREMRGE